MVIAEMIIIPIISLIVLFILTKLMGYRQVSQLSMFDYIIGITIGSIASEFIMGGYKEFDRPLLGMVVYAVCTILISFLARISQKARRIIDGKPIILYEKDCIYNKQLNKAKIDIDEFLMQCRINGYFNLEELELVVLETNGNLSFLPKEKNRPMQVKDTIPHVEPKPLPVILVKEGTIYYENLTKIHQNEEWLLTTLKNKAIALEHVLLLYQEENTNIQVFVKNSKERNFN